MKTIVVITQDKRIAQALADFVKATLSDVYPDPAQVLPACSVDDVLDILARARIDILMTDHYLADMSGMGLVRWLDTALVGTVKILLTCDPRVLAEPWRFIGPEINDVLSRPVDQKALKQMFHRWLGKPFGRSPSGEIMESSDLGCTDTHRTRPQKTGWPEEPAR